jgi:hypothetical protein
LGSAQAGATPSPQDLNRLTDKSILHMIKLTLFYMPTARWEIKNSPRPSRTARLGGKTPWNLLSSSLKTSKQSTFAARYPITATRRLCLKGVAARPAGRGAGILKVRRARQMLFRIPPGRSRVGAYRSEGYTYQLLLGIRQSERSRLCKRSACRMYPGQSRQRQVRHHRDFFAQKAAIPLRSEESCIQRLSGSRHGGAVFCASLFGKVIERSPANKSQALK